MDNKESDKTKIKTKDSREPKAVDKTRIAPAKNKQSSQQSNDKTRIAPKSDKVSPGHKVADRTRIAPPKTAAGSSAKQSADKTRIAPKPSRKPPVDQDADKTLVVPKQGKELTDSDKTQVSPDVTQYKPRDPTDPVKTQLVHNTDQPLPEYLDSPVKVSVTPKEVLKDRFVLEEVLGAGGMGVVYKAKDRLKVEAQDRDPYVAIKVLGEEFKSHPEAFISLQRESRKSQRIAHPNIVNVHDFDRDEDTVFMTMEFLDGSPLDELIKRYQTTGLPTDDCWEIFAGMASALSHAHAEHIIHSDFKPGNVFVTNKGVAKVFDFGIARAVARVEHLDDNPQDQTLFDAGNLGALTPAYASLEMLEGETPDVRDDIYALGCVLYEMLTGNHPYNKVPADEALRQGLVPKKISHIKKYQWRAIERAIAFKRGDRLATVDEFVVELEPKIKSANKWVTILAFVGLAAAAISFNYYQQLNAEPSFSESDIRNEVELKVRIDFHKEEIQLLIEEAGFYPVWEESLWKEISALAAITQTENGWLDQQKAIVYELYLDRIKQDTENKSYSRARALIKNAKRYTQDVALLDALEKDIVLSEEKEANQKKLLALEEQKRKQALLARQRAQAKAKQTQTVEKEQVKQKTAQFDVALDNVNTQLECQGQLNMRNIETAITKLKQLDRNRYRGLEKGIIRSLAACIISVGKAFPERAREAKKQSLRIFNSNPLLTAIDIKSRDPCDQSLAGLGSRGKRALCKDKLKVAGSGPELVVIPASSKNEAFAIGKFEVTINEFNIFCKNSTQCEQIKSPNGELPVSNISLKQARAYIRWLSSQTKQKYRLPSKKEWVYAAKSRRKILDPNRNCELSTRGFQKGGELLGARIGKQNSWGLVNYVGNVQEWAYDSGRKLVAVGGSYQQSMEKCDINTSLSHNGSADKVTGFRVLRELQG